MGDLKRAFESFRENVVYDPISSVLHEAAREGMYPIHPRIVNLYVHPSYKDFDTVITVEAERIPCLKKDFRVTEDELRDIVYADSFGYEIAQRIFNYYRFERPRVEPEPNIVLSEN